MYIPKLLVLVLTAVAYANGVKNCCSNFTASQEAFLRGLLQQEAVGLKAGMMQAMKMKMPPPTMFTKWFKISTKPICFGATGNTYGRFMIKAEGFLSAIKLVHTRGHVTCDRSTIAKTPDEFNSKWGCAPSHPYFGNASINTHVTTANDKIVFPKDLHSTHDHSNLWYNMEQFDSMSDLLVFQRFNDPLYVSRGQELRLWYGEDLEDISEDDNAGQTCAEVFGLYM